MATMGGKTIHIFLRVVCYMVLVAMTAAAQPRGLTPESSKRVAVAVSRDGNMIAIARGNDGVNKRYGRVELWSTRTGELQHMITGFDGPVWSLAFSRDGKSLITASTEYRDAKIQSSVKDRDEKVAGELKWWNTQTGEFIKKISLADEGMTSLEATLSPAGDVLALIERSAELQIHIDNPGPISERTINTRYASIDKTELRLLDAQTGQRKIKLDDASKTYTGYLGRLFIRLEHPVFSPDGRNVAVLAGEDVKIWDVSTGRKILTIKDLKGWPTALAFSEDGRMLAVSTIKGRMPGGDSEITVWEVPTGKSINKLKGRNDSIASLQFAAQGRALLIGSLQYEPEATIGTVKMWDLRENRLGRLDVQTDAAISGLTMIPDQRVVVMQSGSDVELRDAKTWEVRHAFEPAEVDENESMRRKGFLFSANRASSVAFSADGLTVSARIEGGETRVWDVRTGELIRAPSEQPDESSTVISNGRFLAEANVQDGTSQIRILDANSKAVIRTIDASQKITALTIDGTGQLVAAALADYSIGLWDLTTGTLRGTFKKHQDVVNALAFSRDGQTLASGGDDRTAILWDIPSGKAKRTLKGHDVTVTSLAFSPDGSTLATGSGNAAVVLWNVATGKLDRILR
jgi:WD40 repeat protein